MGGFTGNELAYTSDAFILHSIRMMQKGFQKGYLRKQ